MLCARKAPGRGWLGAQRDRGRPDRCAPLLHPARLIPGEAYLRVLRYLLQVAASDDPQPFLDALADEVGTTTREQAMGLLDAMLEKGRAEGEARGIAKGKAEGKAEGRAEGKAEGQLEGQRRTAEKLLQLKFGPLDDGTRARLAALDRDALEAAIERILDANRIEDVIAP